MPKCDSVAIAGGRGLDNNARMNARASTAMVRTTRVAGAMALLLTASCVSYESTGRPADGTTPRLPQPVAKPTPPVATAPLAPPTGATARRGEPGMYRARSGETAWSVARRYGVDASALITANNLVPPFDLYEGQRLVIPGASPPAATAGRSSPEANPEHPTTRPPPASSAEAGGQTAALPRPAAPPPEPPQETEGLVWPVEGTVISDFGAKGGGRYNDGINIAAAAGTPVRAAESGVVAYVGNEARGYGNMLLLAHANGWKTIYAHNEELLVRRGERVRRGQVIARVGATGSVDRPQLHFEIRKGKRAVDPMQELPRPSAAARGRAAG
jgi:murein DD-endopeptidase MepM/ murein hydrolase activator NlpD